MKISSLLPVHAMAEAKALECDYILSSSVAQKVKQGGFGMKNLSSLRPMANMVPGIGMIAGAGKAMVYCIGRFRRKL